MKVNFNLIDDGDGFISPEELTIMMKEILGIKGNDEYIKAIVTATLALYDTNNDGRLDFREFVAAQSPNV